MLRELIAKACKSSIRAQAGCVLSLILASMVLAACSRWKDPLPLASPPPTEQQPSPVLPTSTRDPANLPHGAWVEL